MVGKRKYDDGCAVAHGLDLVGERWALLVVRELLLGPKRFTDLRTGMPAASADVLTQRLRELQGAGIVQRRRLPPPAGSWVYELTTWGAALEPVITGLARWSAGSPSMPHDLPVSADSAALSLKALFDPRAAEGFRTTVGLHLGDDRLYVRVGDGGLSVSRDVPPDPPGATVTTDPTTLSSLLRAPGSLADAERDGTVTVDGSREAVERFLPLFPMPGESAGQAPG
jgi:DNA-binding HxlR family transcriptional regulator